MTEEAPIYGLLKDIILIFLLGIGIGALSAIIKKPELVEIKAPQLMRT